MLFWFAGAKTYGLEHWLYLGHRLSGFGLLTYLLLHIFVTASRLGGKAAWEGTMGVLEHPLFAFLEYLVFAAFVFHAANGIRLILAELGFSLGRPARPVYPYTTCLDRQRRLARVMTAVAAIGAALGAVDFMFWR